MAGAKLPDNAEAGGGLMVAIIQLAIAVGSTVGGFVFDNQGWQSGFALSAALLLSAAVMTWFALRQQGGIRSL